MRVDPTSSTSRARANERTRGKGFVLGLDHGPVLVAIQELCGPSSWCQSFLELLRAIGRVLVALTPRCDCGSTSGKDRSVGTLDGNRNICQGNVFKYQLSGSVGC